jgi:hypothetical protein
MGTLARYQKPGGFLQLVTLLEGLDEKKREQLLTIIQQENARWHSALISKIITFERLIQWPDSVLMELLRVVKPLTLGSALFGLPDNQIQRFRTLIPSTSRMDLKDVLNYESTPPAKVQTARLQMAQHARQLIVDGVLAPKAFAPDLVIPDDIEEDLASSVVKNSAHTAPEPSPKAEPDLRPREELLAQMQKLEAENKRLQQKIQQLTREIESLRGPRRQAA